MSDHHAESVVRALSKALRDTELDSLRTQLASVQAQLTKWENTFETPDPDVAAKEFDDAFAEVERLRNVSWLQEQMLRAFRKSMDSNLPFPSRDKLDALINTPEEVVQSDLAKRDGTLKEARELLLNSHKRIADAESFSDWLDRRDKWLEDTK